MNQLPISVNYKKQGNQMVPVADVDKIREDTFFKSLVEGQKIEVTYQTLIEDGSYSQLSKLHASIRELAKDSGTSFIDMKKEVKQRMNYKLPDGELRSFGDASKEELSQAIQACIEIG